VLKGTEMRNRPHTFPALIAAIMLLVAIAPLPYGYYQFMRWLVCGVAIYIAVCAYRWGKAWAIWIFSAVAVLFNPIFPIHLSREVWLPLDSVGALLFGFSPLFLKKRIEA
jgi:hypothetical protein